MSNLSTLFQEADPAKTPQSTELDPQGEVLLASIVAEPRNQSATTSKGRKRYLTQWFLRPVVTIPIVLVGAFALVFAILNMRPVTEVTQVVADWPWYSSEQELVAAADGIVRGEVGKSSAQVSEGVRTLVVEVEVLIAVKGSFAPGQIMTVRFPDPKFSASHEPYGLTKGTEVVLFFAGYEGFPPSILNPNQTSYVIQPDSTLSKDPLNPIILSPKLLASLGLDK